MRKVLMVLVALMFVVHSAHASTIVLTFEGIGNQVAIGSYYNGGGGGNYGIDFSSNALALESGNYGSNPSQPGIMFFLTGSSSIMNVLAGFDTGFSFFYAGNSSGAGSVTVYDEFGATGNILGSFSLPDTVTPYYVWDPIGVAFSGIAKSVAFSGVANYIGFDDITLGSRIPGQTAATPEPGTMLLMGVGVAGVVFMKRRKAKAGC